MTNDTRVAVLLDGDNISKAHSASVAKLAARYGRADIMRVYSEERHLPQWRDCAPFRFVLVPGAKNSADIVMAIDAVDLSHSGKADTFVLCSSDSDFTHLAQFLRERGHKVIGCGEAKTTQAFRDTCHEFHVLRQPCEAGNPRVEASDLDQLIRKAIAANSKNGRGMALTALSAQLYRQHSVKISTYGEGTWRGYLSKRPELYDLDPKGTDAHVRFRPEGFA